MGFNIKYEYKAMITITYYISFNSAKCKLCSKQKEIAL